MENNNNQNRTITNFQLIKAPEDNTIESIPSAKEKIKWNKNGPYIKQKLKDIEEEITKEIKKVENVLTEFPIIINSDKETINIINIFGTKIFEILENKGYEMMPEFSDDGYYIKIDLLESLIDFIINEEIEEKLKNIEQEKNFPITIDINKETTDIIKTSSLFFERYKNFSFNDKYLITIKQKDDNTYYMKVNLLHSNFLNKLFHR